MWTTQVYGHHDKMARTKTHRTPQTRSIQRRNIHKEITVLFFFEKHRTAQNTHNNRT